ncbi:hypothetical protein BH10PSE6_BH10PSE6_23800 [soil metagenome]
MIKPRILFVGNSHLGCVKLALDGDPDLIAGFDFDFIILLKSGASDIEVADGRLRLTTERAKELATKAVGVITEAALANYQAIVLVGLGLTMNWVGRLYRSHRLLEHRHPEKQLISPSAFQAMVDETVGESAANKVAVEIRSVTDMPILLIAEPPLSVSVQDIGEWDDVWTGNHVAFLAETLTKGIRGVFAPKSVDIAEPPPETITDPYFTKLEYSTKAPNILKAREGRGGATKHKKHKDDFRHMNDAYGALLCRNIARWLNRRSAADMAHTQAAS